MQERDIVPSEPTGYIFWCAKCLKDFGEGEAARVHPDCITGEKPRLDFVTGDGENGEWEMICPVCGGSEFHVNVLALVESDGLFIETDNPLAISLPES